MALEVPMYNSFPQGKGTYNPWSYVQLRSEFRTEGFTLSIYANSVNAGCQPWTASDSTPCQRAVVEDREGGMGTKGRGEELSND